MTNLPLPDTSSPDKSPLSSPDGSPIRDALWSMNDFTEFGILTTAFVISILFVIWFTGSLRPAPVDEEMRHAGVKLRRMVGYCYGIAFGTLVIVAHPFFANFSGDPALQEGAFLVVRGCVAPSDSQIVASVGSCQENRYQWLLSIGAAMTENDSTALVGQGGNFILHGGLTVPLYLVVIALLSGAVSMTRRLPEIQRLCWAYILMEDQRRHPKAYEHQRLDDIHDETKDEYPLPPEIARECIVFQIMQLISAPIIAIIVFEMLAPDSIALAVGIAFVSGFTSEQVLLVIRNTSDKFIAKINIDPDPIATQPKKTIPPSKQPPSEAFGKGVNVPT